MAKTVNPNDKIKREVASLRAKIAELEKSTRLTSMHDSVEDIQTTVNNLDTKVADLRSRGFVYGKGWEEQAIDLANQWKQIHPNLSAKINAEANMLQKTFAPIGAQGTSLASVKDNFAQAQNILNQLGPKIEAVESKVKAAEQQIRGMYDSFQGQANQFSREIREADWMLKQVEEATFQLLATEAVAKAVKAVWVKDGEEDKSDPDGVLYLTDQRLLFEQKEEVATKKILFITTEKEKRHKLLFEAPVALVESVEISKDGFFKNKDNIKVHFAPGAPFDRVHFHIWQNCSEWQAGINRVKSKEIEKDRAVALDDEAVEKVKSAPSKCPSCGGNISQVIMRGQDTITCKFCGHVIRL